MDILNLPYYYYFFHFKENESSECVDCQALKNFFLKPLEEKAVSKIHLKF